MAEIRIWRYFTADFLHAPGPERKRKMLGLAIKKNKQHTKLWVAEVHLEEGSVHEWNRNCVRAGFDDDSIQEKDFIVSVNRKVDVEGMLEQLKRPDYNELFIVLCRRVARNHSGVDYEDI